MRLPSRSAFFSQQLLSFVCLLRCFHSSMIALAVLQQALSPLLQLVLSLNYVDRLCSDLRSVSPPTLLHFSQECRKLLLSIYICWMCNILGKSLREIPPTMTHPLPVICVSLSIFHFGKNASYKFVHFVATPTVFSKFCTQMKKETFEVNT